MNFIISIGNTVDSGSFFFLPVSAGFRAPDAAGCASYSLLWLLCSGPSQKSATWYTVASVVRSSCRLRTRAGPHLRVLFWLCGRACVGCALRMRGHEHASSPRTQRTAVRSGGSSPSSHRCEGAWLLPHSATWLCLTFQLNSDAGCILVT